MLTIKAIESAKPKDKPYKLPDFENLYLYITPSGTFMHKSSYILSMVGWTREPKGSPFSSCNGTENLVQFITKFRRFGGD